MQLFPSHNLCRPWRRNRSPPTISGWIVEGEPSSFHDRQAYCQRVTAGICVSLQGGQTSPTLFDCGSTILKPSRDLKEETWKRRLTGCRFSWLDEWLTAWPSPLAAGVHWPDGEAFPPPLLKLGYRRPTRVSRKTCYHLKNPWFHGQRDDAMPHMSGTPASFAPVIIAKLVCRLGWPVQA